MTCSGNSTTSVKMDGTKSFDPNGDTLSYTWSAPGIAFDHPDSQTPTGKFPYGITTAILEVSDGQATSTDTIVIEVKPCIQINEGASYTNTKDIVLSLSYQSNPTQMRLANNLFKVGDKKPQWQPFSSNKEWDLSGSNGLKTVYTQFKTAGGKVSGVYSARIILDSKKPVVHDIKINNDQPSTTNPDVHVTINARDKLSGVQYMKVGNTGDLSKVAWIPYRAAFDWKLEPLIGNKAQERHIFVQLRDGAQNTSRVFKGSILLK